MKLDEILQMSSNSKFSKQGISEERIHEVLPALRNVISYFREYPDVFIDFIKGEDSKFAFYPYQRIFLRVTMRHRYVYATYPRAYSKSFLGMLTLVIRCVLFPGSQLFVTTGGKDQAGSITLAKVEEICRLIPALHNEIKWERGETTTGKNNVVFKFKNGSKIDILAARESSRGQRRTGGLMEECILIDQEPLNEIIIPTTNVSRLLPDGTRDIKEVVNKSQLYVTTAGWKNSFAYAKLMELFIQSVIEPEEVMIMGGSYEVPVHQGLLEEDFIDNLKLSGTYNEDSFDREYRSIWSGDAENAFFSSDKFDKCRVLLQPEHEYSGRSSKSAFYVLGIDVGRFKCTTEVSVIKVTPQPNGSAFKSDVCLYTYEAEHFEEQAINIKKLYYKYKAHVIAIDGNGIGAGLVDFLVIKQIDPETNEELPPFGIMNDDEGKYKKQKTADTVNDAIYIIKANAPMNTEMYSYTKVQMMSGKIKFLVDESVAKTKLLNTQVGKAMSSSQRNEYLIPFVLTTHLKEQLMNLVVENDGINIILKQDTKKILKDKASAFFYGMYYIKMWEENKKRKRKFKMSDLLMMN